MRVFGNGEKAAIACKCATTGILRQGVIVKVEMAANQAKQTFVVSTTK